MKRIVKINLYDPAKPITEPGIYRNVPIASYHRKIDLFGPGVPSVSSGILRRIEDPDGSMQKVWHRYPLNPAHEPEPDKKAWIMGRAAHTLLLGEAGFKTEFAVQPEELEDSKTGEVKPWHGNRTDCKAWLAKAELAKLSVITMAQVDDIRRMAEALAAHPTVRAGILNGLVEHSMFWKKRGVWIKSRPDGIPVDSDMIVDLKTCTDAGPIAVRKSIGEYGYHQQMALAIEGVRETTGREVKDAILVFIETKAPFAINIKPLTSQALDYGHMQNRRALARFEACWKSGEWPGYDDDEVPADLPDWLEKRLKSQVESSLLLPASGYAEAEAI